MSTQDSSDTVQAVTDPAEDKPKTRTSRRVIIETMTVAIVVSVLSTIIQKLWFGESSIVVSVILTVMMEVLYFRFIARRGQRGTSSAESLAGAEIAETAEHAESALKEN